MPAPAMPRVRLWRPTPGDELVGRSEQVARALHLLQQGVSVAVVGPSWSGRTAVLGAVRRLLEDSGRRVRVVPVPAAPGPREPGPGEVAGDAPGRPGPAPGPLSQQDDVVVVDDVDDLDERARVLLRSTQAQSGVPFLTSRHPRGRRGPHDQVLDIGRPLIEVELGPLGFEHLHRLLSHRLQASLAPDLTARLHREAGGLPGLAVALLDGAIEHGGVRPVAGVWVGERLESPELDGVLDSLLRHVSRKHRDALGLLSRAGPLPVALARSCVGPRALRALELLGLVALTDEGGEHVVLVQPPVLASHLSRRPLTIRALERIEAALERLAAVPGEDLRVQQAREHLMAAAHPLRSAADPEEARLRRGPIHGPELLGQAVQHELAVALGRWQTSRRVPDAVRLLSLAAGEREPRALVERVLAGTDTTPDRDTFAYVDFRFKAARWAVHLGANPVTAARELQTALPPQATHRDAAWLLGYLLEVEFHELPEDYEQALAPFLSADGHDQPTARVVLAACRMIDGRCEEAEDLLDVDREAWPLLLATCAELILGVAAFGRGDPEEAIRRGAAMFSAALTHASTYLGLASALVTALGLLTSGRLDDARRLLLTALSTHGGWTAPLSPEAALRGLLIYVAQLTSPDTLVPAFLDPADPAGSAPGRGEALPFSSPRLVDAVAIHHGGDSQAASRMTAQLATDLRSAGYVLPADAIDLARLLATTDPVRVGALTSGTTRLGGARLRTLLDARQARVDADPGALVDHGARFEELALPYEAARAYTLAATMFQQAGEHELASRARSAVDRLRIVEPGAHVTPATADSALSVRELEIVDLVAQGRTNAQIAARLYLSVRTVDAHLRNIRRKTGAGTRADIAGLSGTRST